LPDSSERVGTIFFVQSGFRALAIKRLDGLEILYARRRTINHFVTFKLSFGILGSAHAIKRNVAIIKIRRPTRVMNIVQWVHIQLWIQHFGNLALEEGGDGPFCAGISRTLNAAINRLQLIICAI